jgi:hypothetical protein
LADRQEMAGRRSAKQIAAYLYRAVEEVESKLALLQQQAEPATVR